MRDPSPAQIASGRTRPVGRSRKSRPKTLEQADLTVVSTRERLALATLIAVELDDPAYDAVYLALEGGHTHLIVLGSGPSPAGLEIEEGDQEQPADSRHMLQAGRQFALELRSPTEPEAMPDHRGRNRSGNQ
jgi:hypothetical protein